ncbi:hypothetical protein [Streptomyces sp. NRRL WC-3742]|uniref:hypothetical protein n=1 Tax=Streptomyces sp. NRRL WC-3742 TaxID=1463934 RepID=UPI0004C8AE71|nr:hypothetical protein [Streptomyces sp. NRRL WC-3742]
MTTVTTAPSLRDQLRELPDEAFTRLQYLAPAVGCLNACAMCSQGAGHDVWQLTERGLTDLVGALADVAAERGLRLAGGRDHRPGVLFPYLDNDIASYPYLDTYAALARDVLGVKLRVSTIGYSSNSPQLVAMHQRIVSGYGDVFSGIRFSLTPYAIGYQGKAPGTSRTAYTHDLASALATYRPLLDRLGHGAPTAAVELRFSPLLGTDPLTDTHVGGRHVLACGPHLLIAENEDEMPLPYTEIERLDENNQPVYSRPGAPYLHVVTSSGLPIPVLVDDILTGALDEPHLVTEVRVHRFANADGDHFAADCDFHPDGRFTALHLYTRTDKRRTSGYTDATRHFLNELLAHKATKGLGRREEFLAATWADTDAVLAALAAKAERLTAVDPKAADHLRNVVVPLVTTYATALIQAGYPASLFFSRAFTIDTGQIVNQGRAQGLFRGLAATNGEPMTPREERGFGQVSVSSSRGPIWRITPLPTHPTTLPIARSGRKNPTTGQPALLVEEMDPCHLSPVMRATGCRLRRFTLTGIDIEHTGRTQGTAAFGMPGLTPTS